MHFVNAKGILSANNGMNIYRGCLHGCIYCDSRSACYAMTHEFEDVEVKQNAPELLEAALRRKRSLCMVGTGSMSDPYNPLERELCLTRRCLEIILKYGFGVTLITKSADVLRDLKLLREINSSARAVVQMTLTTADEGLCRIIEPNVSTTAERFKALCALRDAGIPTVVWLCPLLPFINDTPENLEGVLDYCVRAGVKGIIWFGAGVTLREGDREYFYEKLDEHFPTLKRRYMDTYGQSYSLESPNSRALNLLLHEVCKKHNINCDQRSVFEFLHYFPDAISEGQTSLF